MTWVGWPSFNTVPDSDFYASVFRFFVTEFFLTSTVCNLQVNSGEFVDSSNRIQPSYYFDFFERCLWHLHAGGRKGKGRGGGGGGRGVRGVDFGLGIGYNAEPSNTPPPTASRTAAVNSLRTGMMAQFKSSFVAASSNSPNQVISSAYQRPALSGFVSGGTIGGDSNRPQATSAVNYPPSQGGNVGGQNSDRKISERWAYSFVLVFFFRLKPFLSL